MITAAPQKLDSHTATVGLIDYLSASPSPFHACATSARMLTEVGFTRVNESDPFPTDSGGYFVVRSGSLIAWHSAAGAPANAPFRVVGAHTDSPGLRIKPQPDVASAGFRQLGVEVYGGPLLNSWLDRDLGLSGRVSVRAASLDRREIRGFADAAAGAAVIHAGVGDPAGIATLLLHVDEPLLRVAQLAIHLDRGVNSDGVKLNPQQHLAPLWALGDEPANFTAWVADRLNIAPADVLGWDLMLHDTQAPQRIGAHEEFIAGARMDNLATSYAGTVALIAAAGQDDGGADDKGADVHQRDTSYAVPLLALFDHEEVGSVSERGAAADFLPTILERIVLAAGGTREDFHRSMAATIIASGDMAHATHPNYADKHEPQHRISIGGGPVLKVNNQLRYATGSPGAAAFALACEQAGVPMQQFVTRSDLPCGSTVGPVTAARTGAQTVDFGAPMLSMHSIRELVGAADQAMYAAALTTFLAPAP